MSEETKIEWADATFNPWIGCTKLSPGCANCYAEELMDKRYGRVNWGKGNPRSRTSEANWKLPLRWNRKAGADLLSAAHILRDEKAGNHNIEWAKAVRRPRVFCASLADWLDPEVPIEWLAEMLDTIRRTPHLDWLCLSKRPELWGERISSVRSYLSNVAPHTAQISWTASWGDDVSIPSNVWVGTSVEDQKRAEERIPELLRIPARVRFLSCEPLLGPVDLHTLYEGGSPNNLTALDSGLIHWVICGGESGPNARPMNPDWARSLRDQCRAAGVAFFMKQMGGARKPFEPIPEDLMVREFPEVER